MLPYFTTKIERLFIYAFEVSEAHYGECRDTLISGQLKSLASNWPKNEKKIFENRINISCKYLFVILFSNCISTFTSIIVDDILVRKERNRKKVQNVQTEFSSRCSVVANSASSTDVEWKWKYMKKRPILTHAQSIKVLFASTHMAGGLIMRLGVHNVREFPVWGSVHLYNSQRWCNVGCRVVQPAPCGTASCSHERSYCFEWSYPP